MTNPHHTSRGAPTGRFPLVWLLFTGATLVPFGVFAQESSLAATKETQETFTLPEFSVSTTADKGYRAGNSVSATRVNTPIKDLPFAVSAFTAQFIADI